MTSHSPERMEAEAGNIDLDSELAALEAGADSPPEAKGEESKEPTESKEPKPSKPSEEKDAKKGKKKKKKGKEDEDGNFVPKFDGKVPRLDSQDEERRSRRPAALGKGLNAIKGLKGKVGKDKDLEVSDPKNFRHVSHVGGRRTLIRLSLGGYCRWFGPPARRFLACWLLDPGLGHCEDWKNLVGYVSPAAGAGAICP